MSIKSLGKSLRYLLPISLVVIFVLTFLYYPREVKASGLVSVEVGLNNPKSFTIKDSDGPIYRQSYSTPITIQTASNNYEIDLSGEKVKIGSATNSFTPVIRFSHFSLGSYVELNLVGSGGQWSRFKDSTFENNTITAENTYLKVQYSSVEQNQGFNELGGVDYAITLKQNPGLSSIGFTYNKQNAIGYLQPPFTSEYISGYSDVFGCEIGVNATNVWRVSDGHILLYRPLYVVNSIAFYHDTKGGWDIEGVTDCGTGKIGHLYSMLVTDSSAIPKTTWTAWGFGGDQSQITLSINQTYLATAAYPITIAPVGDTFGFTGIGGTPDYGVNAVNASRSTNFTTPVDISTISMMEVYIYRATAGRTGNYKGMVHNVTNTATGRAFIGATPASNQITSTAGWVNATFSSPLSLLPNTQYFFGAIVGNPAPDVDYWILVYDSGASSLVYSGDDFSNCSYATPGKIPNWSSEQPRKYSIKMTYTPTGGVEPDITNTPGFEGLGVVQQNSTYYAKGGSTAPSWPLGSTNCTFTLSNVGSINVTISAKATNWTGGASWNLTTAAPSENKVRLSLYRAGDNLSDNLTLSTVDQTFKSDLGPSVDILWDFKLETGTFTDGVLKSTTITFTATAL